MHIIPTQITQEQLTEHARHSQDEECKYRAVDAFIGKEIEPIMVRIHSEATNEDEDNDYQLDDAFRESC